MRRLIGEFKAAARSPAPYLIWTAVTAMLTIGGPFGTFVALTAPERAIYWGVVVAFSIVAGKGVRIALAVLGELPIFLHKVLVSATIALVLAPLIWAYSWWTMGAGAIPGLPSFVFFVFVVAFAVQLVRLALQHRHPAHAPPPTGQADPPGSAQPRLLERIAPERRGRLLRVSARNHHLEVVTEAGRTDILLRFSDGLAEIGGVEGAQVHRSHWVAWDAVARVERRRNRFFLRLCDGAEVPVSQSYEHRLKDRGLI